MDAVLVALPKLLFCSISALPLLIGVIAARRHLRAGAGTAYFLHLFAAVAGGAVALALLWSSLFGDNLSKSSTAALILAIAPVYAAAAQGLVFAIGTVIIKKSSTPRAIGPIARAALLIPALMLAVLMFGLVNIAFEGNESEIAERSANLTTLRELYGKSRSGELDAFSIPLHLAQNPAAPADILNALASHDHPTVRANVASNRNTPLPVVAALRYDCAGFVRKVVAQRLGPDTSGQPAPAPTGHCALARWR
ncbi:MAG TPA: hypothetical protein VFS95_13955 [Telluria sp.]|nr:hypothetical protein [Telluria sp.]